MFPELKGIRNDHTYSYGETPAIVANRRLQGVKILGKAFLKILYKTEAYLEILYLI